jgi:integrase
MGTLTDRQIKSWIQHGERFEGRGDGDGLALRFRKNDATPNWLFRYNFAGKPRVLNIGSYKTLSLADARRTAKELRARVALGHDVAGEKKQRKADALTKIATDKSIISVAKLADDYFAAQILGKWKHPNIVRSRIEKDIKPNMGKLALRDVRPTHIDEMLKTIVARGAPTTANDVLRWVKRMFNYAMKRGLVLTNPAMAFDQGDAGGYEVARDRWLTRAELVTLFDAMRKAPGLAHQNVIAVKLLLLLAVRKGELIAARVNEFDLDAKIWRLPSERTKTGAAIEIPLPLQAVDLLSDLIRMADGSDWLLPARKSQVRMLPHISPDTVGAALNKSVRPLMKGAPAFTVHDFRRTARTHIEALGTPPHIGERCLNHKLKGVVGIYNQHDYFEERKSALQAWADLLELCEKGKVDSK